MQPSVIPIVLVILSGGLYVKYGTSNYFKGYYSEMFFAVTAEALEVW